MEQTTERKKEIKDVTGNSCVIVVGMKLYRAVAHPSC